MSAILTEIISLLVGGITGIASGLGTGIQSLVSSLFIDSTGSAMALSTFGGMVAIFAGIGLAVGLSRLIFNWLITLGGRK